MIYHITTRKAWAKADDDGIYTTESLAKEGFIHCSTREQVVTVGNRFYKDVPDCVLLGIDEAQLMTPPVWEPPAHPDGAAAEPTDEKFPHIYGPIMLDAVIKVVDFKLGADGSYTFPADMD